MSIRDAPLRDQPPRELPGSVGTVARADTRDAEGLSVRPRSTRREPHDDVSVGGVCLAEAADRFGIPVYVLDEQEVRERCRSYRMAFAEADVVYAAKAFLSRAMAHWTT